MDMQHLAGAIVRLAEDVIDFCPVVHRAGTHHVVGPHVPVGDLFGRQCGLREEVQVFMAAEFVNPLVHCRTLQQGRGDLNPTVLLIDSELIVDARKE